MAFLHPVAETCELEKKAEAGPKGLTPYTAQFFFIVRRYRVGSETSGSGGGPALFKWEASPDLI